MQRERARSNAQEVDSLEGIGSRRIFLKAPIGLARWLGIVMGDFDHGVHIRIGLRVNGMAK